MTIKERKTNITDNVPINPVKDKRLPMVSLSYPNPPTNLKGNFSLSGFNSPASITGKTQNKQLCGTIKEIHSHGQYHRWSENITSEFLFHIS